MTELVTIDRLTARHGRGEVATRHPAVTLPPPSHPLEARTAAQVMTRFPVTVDQHTSLFTAWAKLRAARAQHLVVTAEGLRPVGVLNERDIVLHWPPGPLGAHELPVYELLRHRTRPRVQTRIRT